MADKNSVARRIDFELDEILKKIKISDDINYRQASKKLAKLAKSKLNGEKITFEFKF